MYSQFRLQALAEARVQLELDKLALESDENAEIFQNHLSTAERQINYLDSQIEITKRNAPIEAAEMGGNLMKSMMRSLDDEDFGGE